MGAYLVCPLPLNMKVLLLLVFVAVAYAVPAPVRPIAPEPIRITHTSYVYGQEQVVHRELTTFPMIYRFAVGHDHGAYGHVTPTGEYKGLWVDILKEVCKRAGKTCYTVLDRYEHCWTQDEHYLHYEYPGIGLMDKYFAGCIGWVQTLERLNAMNFTMDIHPASELAVLIDPTKFTGDPKVLTGKKCGHIKGWWNMQTCLAKQPGFTGHAEGEYTMINFNNMHDLIEALHKGTIDFTIAPLDIMNTKLQNLKIVKPAFTCTTHGYAVMVPKGSEVITWWNKYFTLIKNDGTLTRLCTEAKTKYITYGPVKCFE